MPGVLSIGWILVGDRRVASARLQGWMIHGELRRRGHASVVLNRPGAFDTRLRWKAPRRWLEAVVRRRRILVFQKVESSRAVRLAALARRMGTRVVFVQADALHSPLYALAHRVVVSSGELARILGPMCAAPLEVIPDPLDLPPELVSQGSERRRNLRLLWVGHRFNFPALGILRAVLDRPEMADMTLVTVSDHPDADYPWSPERVRAELLRADVGVIPCEETPANRAKSSNRLTLFMGAGVPAVATPLPSYETAARHGEHAFLVRGDDAWASALDRLRDPSLRRRMGTSARRAAWERFAPECIADRWERLFLGLAGLPAPARGRGTPAMGRPFDAGGSA